MRSPYTTSIENITQKKIENEEKKKINENEIQYQKEIFEKTIKSKVTNDLYTILYKVDKLTRKCSNSQNQIESIIKYNNEKNKISLNDILLKLELQLKKEAIKLKELVEEDEYRINEEVFSVKRSK